MSQPTKPDFGLIFGIGVGGQILFLLGCSGQNDHLTVAYLYFGQSEVRALPLGVAAERSVHYDWDNFLYFLSFPVTYFSPRRGCPRVVKFCMGS